MNEQMEKVSRFWNSLVPEGQKEKICGYIKDNYLIVGCSLYLGFCDPSFGLTWKLGF